MAGVGVNDGDVLGGMIGAEDAARLKRSFTDFLDSATAKKDYAARVRDLVSAMRAIQDAEIEGAISGGGGGGGSSTTRRNGRTGANNDVRLKVDVGDLRAYDASLARELLDHPSDCIDPFEDALRELCLNLDPRLDVTGSKRPRLGFHGGFGFNAVGPRELLAPLMGKLVKVEGIVTKCSLVRPKVVKSVHYCAETNAFVQRAYRDVTSHTGLPTGSAYPTRDDQGNLLTTEYGLCDYEDHQVVSLQEMPEDAPPGQLPRGVDVLCEADLVDRAKPGDRVAVCGVYKAVPVKSGSSLSGVFKTVLVATEVELLSKEVASPRYTADDLKNIKKLGRRGDVMKLLASSVAPSIYGHDHIKRAMVLVLAGGVEKNLENGTHLRGDINMLMVGDPGVAKSQMLRAVMGLAPLSVATTGRGSSGVGLTAAVTTDSETGERRLEAGAMVLADRGIVCIDEFDKMGELDRVAIHEVMEQQTVTIAKAGIHTSLNARCSVVAAANPVYGSYDHSMSITRNVALPDSLLSRFDLLFIVLDNMTANNDRDLSEHVLRMHRYRGTEADEERGPHRRRREAFGDEDDEEDDEDDDEPQDASTRVFVKYDRMLHGDSGAGGATAGGRGSGGDSSRRQQLLAPRFLRKYIKYCKDRFVPTLGADACSAFTAAYTSMRLDQTDKTLPVTARTLETMIRLASAHAKLHMRREVSAVDADAALDLMRFAIYAEEKTSGDDARREKKRNAKKQKLGADEDDTGAAANAAAAGRAQETTPRTPRTRVTAQPADEDIDEDIEAGSDGGAAAAAGTAVAAPDAATQEAIGKVLLDLLARERRSQCSLQELVDAVRGTEGLEDADAGTVEAVMLAMTEAGKVMLTEGIIYIV